MKKLIEIKNLSIELNWNIILSDINLEIFENEILAIIWLNWAWKSTLLKAIIWIYKPTKWVVISYINKFWYVPQKLDFDKTIPISVYEFLKIYSNKSKDQIYESLEYLNSINLIDKKIGSLSWWELQKILIVNAILQDSKLLLLDEPTSGIDLISEKWFYDFIEKIFNKYKLSIILVSHDIHTVFSKASRVICLNKIICCIWKPTNIINDDFFKKVYWKHLAPYSHKHDIK